jgi:hypothetical protein
MVASAHVQTWTPSSKRDPCPLCSRDKNGSCRTSANGEVVMCHMGSTHHPPTTTKGEVVEIDGVRWRCGGISDERHDAVLFHLLTEPLQANGHRQSSRVVPLRRKPKPAPLPSAITLAMLPEPWPDEPPAHLPQGFRIPYSPHQWTVWEDGKHKDKDGNVKDKGERPRHRGADGKTVGSKGTDSWPLFGADLLRHAAGHWITAAEGPKCARWLQAGGLVAVSQPGHDHGTAAITRRFEELRAAGVTGMAYVADHDEMGRTKAEQLTRCAAEADFPLLVIHAAEVWPGIPEKGSIDDAPGTAAERAEAVRAAAARELLRQSEPEIRNEPEPQEPSRLSLQQGQDKVKALRASLQTLEGERDPIIRHAALYSLRQNLGITNQRDWAFLIGALVQEQEQPPPSDFDGIMGLETSAAPLATDLFARGLLTLIAAEGGLGKTSLVYRLAEAVSHGTPFAGQHSTTAGNVRIYQLDESPVDAKRKFERMGLDPCRERFSLRWKFSPAELPELRREIEENQLSLVILDSLFRIFGGYGQQITDPETALWLYQLNKIASDTGAAIALTHHLTKPAPAAKRTRTEVTAHDLFGSTYLFNATGDCWGLYRSPREGAEDEYCLRCLKSRSGIVTTGTTYDLQGSEEDYSWLHSGITGSTESLTDRVKGRERVWELLHSRGAAMTADQVAAALHLARRDAQKHLTKLWDERLVTREKSPSNGGRPGWGYRAVPLARA